MSLIEFVPSLAAGERQIDQVIAYCLRHRGTLYLTDRRLIFEYGEGLVAKKLRQSAVSLADIQSVTAHHPRIGSPELLISAKDTNNGFGTNTIAIRIAMSPEVWVGKINTVLSDSSRRPSQPTLVMEKEVVKTPCKYCGSLIDAFRNSKCPNCGAPLR